MFILGSIHTNLGAVWNQATPVDNGIANNNVLANFHLGHHHRVCDFRPGTDHHTGKQQRAPHGRAGYHTSARYHRINGKAAALIMVKDKLGGR